MTLVDYAILIPVAVVVALAVAKVERDLRVWRSHRRPPA